MKKRISKKYNLERRVKVLIVIVLVGLIIFGLVNFGVYFLKDNLSKEIDNELQDCVDDALISGLQFIGLEGGSLVSENYLPIDGLNVAYYSSSEDFISLNEIESELDLYVEFSLRNCGENVEFESIQAETNIGRDNILSLVKVSILKEGKKIKRNYRSEMEINFKGIYDVAENILENQITDLDSLSEFGFNIFITPYGDKYLYSIRDSESFLDGIPYTFRFGMGEKNEAES